MSREQILINAINRLIQAGQPKKAQVVRVALGNAPYSQPVRGFANRDYWSKEQGV